MLRKWWWAGLAGLLVLVYAGLIVTAYIWPPLHVHGVSKLTSGRPAVVVEIVNRGRWPVWVTGVSVKGVPQPDLVGSLQTVGNPAVDMGALESEEFYATGSLPGLWVEPGDPYGETRYGISLGWSERTDMRWLDCPTVRYRYLGWPLRARGFCEEHPRLPGTTSHLPDELADWEDWRPEGDRVEYRTQRVGDDLWIMVAAGPEAAPLSFGVKEFGEELEDGRARMRLVIAALEVEPMQPFLVAIPLHWDEADPELEVEILDP